MKRYQGRVKDSALHTVGWNISAYQEITGGAPFPDSVDKVILGAARVLKARYEAIFGLLYHCKSIPEARKLTQAIYDRELKEATIRDYMRRSRLEVIKEFRENMELQDELREAIEDDQRKKNGPK